MINGFNDDSQRQRAKTQMTLGGMIERLSQLDPDMQIDGLAEPHSYRGYYVDLAFETSDAMPVSEMLSMANDCMGETFEGYKGGDFTMGRTTPVWIADYGCCGLRLMGINDDGTFVTAKDD